VDVALAGLKRDLAGLGNLVSVKVRKERVLESRVNPKLMVGLGKEQPSVKPWSTMIGCVESSEWSSADELYCGKSILESKQIFCR